MTHVRAVLYRHSPGFEEWLCATLYEGVWTIPDTQCGGHFTIDESRVLRSVPIPETP